MLRLGLRWFERAGKNGDFNVLQNLLDENSILGIWYDYDYIRDYDYKSLFKLCMILISVNQTFKNDWPMVQDQDYLCTLLDQISVI